MGRREKSRIYVFWPLLMIAYCTTLSPYFEAISATCWSKFLTAVTRTDELELRNLPLKQEFALALQPVSRKSECFECINAIGWRSLKDDDDFSSETQTISIV